MAIADVDALESWAKWFDMKELTGHAAKNLRDAIQEILALREESIASRVWAPLEYDEAGIQREYRLSSLDDALRLYRARRATDALSASAIRAASKEASDGTR